MSTNKRERPKIEGGNMVRFEAKSEGARITMKGTGTIHAYVGTDGVNYKEVDHNESFNQDGVAVFPIACFIGDCIKFTATTITSVEINWSIVNGSERG